MVSAVKERTRLSGERVVGSRDEKSQRLYVAKGDVYALFEPTNTHTGNISATDVSCRIVSRNFSAVLPAVRMATARCGRIGQKDLEDAHYTTNYSFSPAMMSQSFPSNVIQCHPPPGWYSTIINSSKPSPG